MCWNCGTSRDGSPDADFVREADATDDQSPTQRQHLLFGYPRLPHSKPWYLHYPLSSFIALILAGAVTMALWAVLVFLAEPGMPGQLVPTIVAWLAYIVIIVTLFTVMWYFQSGVVTSIIIAFVAWCHVGVIGLGLLWGLTGGVYEGPVEMISPLSGILCIMSVVGAIHGAIVGARHGRMF